jgi:hypothetical protein
MPLHPDGGFPVCATLGRSAGDAGPRLPASCAGRDCGPRLGSRRRVGRSPMHRPREMRSGDACSGSPWGGGCTGPGVAGLPSRSCASPRGAPGAKSIRQGGSGNATRATSASIRPGANADWVTPTCPTRDTGTRPTQRSWARSGRVRSCARVRCQAVASAGRGHQAHQRVDLQRYCKGPARASTRKATRRRDRPTPVVPCRGNRRITFR